MIQADVPTYLYTNTARRRLRHERTGSHPQSDHVNHVSTQLPYAVTAAAISFVCYISAGLLAAAGLPGVIMLPVGMLATVGLLLIIKKRQTKA